MSTLGTDTRNLLPPTTERREEERRAQERSAEVVAGGSMAEAVAGIAGIVLAIVALAGVFPAFLGPIAAIVIGAGLVLEGAAVASRYAGVLAALGDTERTEVELGGGMSAELLGGLAGIVLGILALIHVATLPLLAVAAIVFGAALIIGCAATAGLNQMAVRRFWGTTTREAVSRHVVAEAVSAAGGAQVLVGLGAVVLGIIALVMVPEPTAAVLALVAFLCVGASLLMSGAALSGKFLSVLNRRW